MRRFAFAAIALAALANCAEGPSARLDNFAGIPRELNQEGVSFGVGRVPGEDALTFQVHFKISSTGEDEGGHVTDKMWLNVAKAAAPKGCSVKKLTPTPQGGRKAQYQC